jgi:hypothetical protein
MAWTQNDLFKVMQAQHQGIQAAISARIIGSNYKEAIHENTPPFFIQEQKNLYSRFLTDRGTLLYVLKSFNSTWE